MTPNKKIAFAVLVSIAVLSGSAAAVVNYRAGVLYGSAASWLAATGKTDGHGTYWNNDGHLYAHHDNGTETLADAPAVGAGGGTVTSVGTSSGLAGGPLTSTGSLTLDSAWFATNARSSGATGNGSTDDTSAFQAAITATPAGGTLFVPSGTYKLVGSGTELLLVNKAINIECAGWNTILNVASTVPNTTDVVHFTAPTGGNVGASMRNCMISATYGSTKAITAATNATPISITASLHGFSTGDTVNISSVGGNTNTNGIWKITVVDINTFTLNGSKGNAAYTSGGTAAKVPGRHGINLDVTSGNTMQNIALVHNNIQQLGGRAIVTTNPTPVLNGVFLVDIRDNILRGGINLSKAGDSILIKGNTISGGFNGIDVDLVQGAGNPAGGGAHLLSVEDNNVTSQGCFMYVSNGSSMRVENNNVEPGATGGTGIDTSNCPNNAALDLDGNSTTPIYTAIIRKNFITNWSNNSTVGNVIRANWTVGATMENNDLQRSVGGPFAYIVTSNAVGTRVDIPTTEDNSITGTLVSDAGARTWLHFYNPDGSEEFGSTTSISYRMRIRCGSTQSGDCFNIRNNAGTNLIQVPATGDVLLGGGTDNGFPVELGITQATGRVEFAGGTILKRTTVADANYTAVQADNVIAWTSLTAGRTLTLPVTFRLGTIYVVKNETAGAFAITATPTSGTCDGAASCATAAAARASMRLYFDGTNWETF